MLQIQSIVACVLCLPFLYLISSRNFLNSQQLELLLSALLLLILIALNTPLIYPLSLLLIGRHVLVIYNSSRSTFYFSRLSIDKINKLLQCCFEVDDRQIMMVFYTVLVYLWVRICTIKSWNYDIGGGNFILILHGWNCTFIQFWFINFLWLLFIFGAWFACSYLIKYQTDHNNLYKEYLRNYLIYPDVFILIVTTYYHLQAYLNSQQLAQCKQWYENGYFFHKIWLWGIPFSTLLFFFMKHGVFLIKSSSQRAEECENELDQKLNHEQIEREHSRVSQHRLSINSK